MSDSASDSRPAAELELLATTRAIRRYRDEPIPVEDLAAMLFSATRAPSGSNRQGFRFLVIHRNEAGAAPRRILATAAQAMWAHKRTADGYDGGSGVDAGSPKARMAATMQHYVEHLGDAPVIILACALRHRPGPEETIGASVYPACQNLLLAARALGYGGVMTTWHRACEDELRAELDIPEDVFLAATITLGVPMGRHGPVRRRPLDELVWEGRWGTVPEWAVDPPGTRFTSAGPPRPT